MQPYEFLLYQSLDLFFRTSSSETVLLEGVFIMPNLEYKPFTNTDNQPFMKLHKFVWLETPYQPLKNACKYLFCYYLNQTEQAYKNDSIRYNEQNQPYIVIKNQAIQDDLGLDTKTIKKYKDDLYNCGLLIKGTKKQELIINDTPTLEHPCSTFYNATTQHREYTYIAMPKFLFHDAYRNIPLNGKILYCVYRDRFKLSLKNSEHSQKFVDRCGKVYTVIPNYELSQLFNCSVNSISKYTSQLIAIGLIQKQSINYMGTDRIYVKEPIALPVNQKQEKASKNRFRLTTRNHIYMGLFYTKTGNYEVENGKNENQKWEKLGYSHTNISQTYNNTNNNLLLSNVSDDYDEFEQMMQEEQQKSLPSFNQYKDMKDKQKENKLKHLPHLLQINLNRLNDIKELSAFIGIIIDTKNEFNRMYDMTYMLEDVEFELSQMIKVVFESWKQNNQIQNVYAYLKTCVFQVFKDKCDQDYESGVLESSRDQQTQKDLIKTFGKLRSMNRSIYQSKKKQIIDEAELDELGVF